MKQVVWAVPGGLLLAGAASGSPLLTEDGRLVLSCAIAGLLGGSAGLSAAVRPERQLRWPARLRLIVQCVVAGIATYGVLLFAWRAYASGLSP